MTKALRAMQFAMGMHSDQKRKYTGAPYFTHLAEVAGLVAAVGDVSGKVSTDDMVAVAWLHDIREDQGISGETIEGLYGMRVAVGVALLSDFETGNRAQRKALGRQRLAAAPGWVQTIKCADLISNTSSIVIHDPNFAKVYLWEKKLLLKAMTKADPQLLERATRMCQSGLREVGVVSAPAAGP